MPSEANSPRVASRIPEADNYKVYLLDSSARLIEAWRENREDLLWKLWCLSQRPKNCTNIEIEFCKDGIADILLFDVREI